MGNVLNKIKSTRSSGYDPGLVNSKRKRKREEDVEDESKNLDVLNTPKRKRIKSTSKYIYQTLFLEGENSDVTIRALNKDWKLHRLYLKQSPYFCSMFSGSWKESDMEVVNIDIVDENITEEALKISFGSLYKDDIFIKPVQVVGVLAAATLFQLDSLIQQCCIMMTQTLCSTTVCVYHSACVTYGVEEMSVKCFSWLTRNILTTDNITFIKDIGIELMSKIVSCPNLFVMQVEIDIYTLLKKWIFLSHNPDWLAENSQLLKDADTFLKTKVQDSSPCYLMSEEGRQYFAAFSAIRWHHVVNDITSIKMLEYDRLLPVGCLDPMFLYGWRRLLSVEQGIDKGPVEDIEEKVFDECCTRCGRVLQKDGDYCWRWVGYNYGVDLLVVISNRILSIKRNTATETCPQAVSLQALRHLCYRMTISSVDKDGKETYRKSSGIRKISLGKDEILIFVLKNPHLLAHLSHSDKEEIVFVLEKTIVYPLAVSMNLLLLSPNPEYPLPRLVLPDG